MQERRQLMVNSTRIASRLSITATALGSMVILCSTINALPAADHVVDFEKVEIGKPVAKWEDEGIFVSNWLASQEK